MPRASLIGAISCGRVIDLTARKGCAQVDIALCIRRVVTRIRNCKSVADLLMVRSPEIITKEKQLIFDDGTADAAPVIVVGKVPERPAKVRSRIDSAILDKFESRSVERIRT